MTELGRDARALVMRVKRSDGPSGADRERLRRKLDPAWAAQRAELAPAADLVAAPRLAQGWTSWTAGLLLLSLGFIAPEAPRSVDPLPAPVPAALATAHGAGTTAQPTAAKAAQQPGAPEAAAAPTLVPTPQHVPAARSAARTAARRSQRPGPAHAARVTEPKPEAAALATAAAEPAPAAVRDPEPQVAAVRDREPEPRATARYGSQARAPAASGGDLALNLRNDGFSPQPIDDELTWLSAAQEALTKHQPSTALRLVQEHAFRFPQGALAVERTAVHALALCALGRKVAARDVIADLAHRAPQSPLLARVQRNCGM